MPYVPIATGVSPAVTALIGIATAAVGAGLGNVFGAWRERSSMKWQARDNWLREIREVLDDAARAVTQAMYAFEQRRTAGPDKRDELGAAAYARLMEAEVAGNRIAMRVGQDSDAARCWRDVVPALDRLSTLTYELGGGSLDDLPDEDREKWTGARDDVTARRDAFFAAAEAWLDERELQLPGRPRLSSHATGRAR